MELIRGLHNLRPEHRGCVATIGNFDGVHLGHQAVLGQLAEQAEKMGLPTVVIIFEPQPHEFFAGSEAKPRLTRLREKYQALKRYSVDRVLCIRFDREFANLKAESFIDQVLIQGLDVQYLVVGDDFRFGRGREGTFDLLKDTGRKKGFPVVTMHTFSIDGQRVSSTLVRDALFSGDLELAEKLLGRPYRMCGRVAHGDKRGRTIGFPTANIHLHRKASPVQGVYAVEMFGIEGEPVAGIANVGNRPTVDGTRSLLEVHLFDFDQEIYGQYVQVDFDHRIRDEMKFDSFDQLKQQIKKDVIEARDWFGLKQGKGER